MPDNRTPAECFPPGEFIAEELEARGWSHQDLADKMRFPVEVVGAIILITRPISPLGAYELGKAFGTSMTFWTNLEQSYRNHLANKTRTLPHPVVQLWSTHS